jgi:indole-3-glycerol phosphate synthase
MNSILEKIVETKQAEVKLLKKNNYELIKRSVSKDFKRALCGNHLSVIAEIKRRSPAKGSLAAIADPVQLATKYMESGASAISVLTDADYFSGKIDDLQKISLLTKNTSCVTLRKDFIIDEVQIIEAIAAGADAILLIVALLQEKTELLLTTAKALNIAVVVEVHNYAELNYALAIGSEIIGVNNRNLDTFGVDLQTSHNLIKHIPKEIIKIAESGIHSAKSAQQLYQAGFNAVLVGEALVTSPDPALLIAQMRGLA